MKVSSLNILASGLIWRQDHNGFSHQDPGFLDVVANKSPSVVRIYLPPDANCLLPVGDHCFRSQNYVNVIVADKQPQDMRYLEMESAITHCTKGLGIWNWASNDPGTEPDLGLASCGDVPTLMCLAATAQLRKHLAMWHRLGKCQLDWSGKPLRREQTGNPVESVKAKSSPLVNNVGGKKA